MGLQLSINRAPSMAIRNQNNENDLSDSDSNPELPVERFNYDNEANNDLLHHPVCVEKRSTEEMEAFSSDWCKKRPLMTYSFDCESNGRILGGNPIPEEILSVILSLVDTTSLLNCRLVCQRWKYIIDSDIWRFKFKKEIFRKLQTVLIDLPSPFRVFFRLYRHKSLNRNLIKNPCGEEGLCHWDIVKNGGDGWRVENPPTGAEALFLDEDFPATSCFATSFSPNSKIQLVDLWAEGIAPIIMDELTPTIYVSEWYAGRFDCACTYTLYVALLNEEQREVDEFRETKKVEQWLGKDWQKVEHEFKDYCEGVRYIKFFHSGCDCQFWKGHYGSKMSRACVKVIL